MRLPLPNREDLDEDGKKAYDRGNTPGAIIAGLQGPCGHPTVQPEDRGDGVGAQPLSALRGGLHRRMCARSRS